MKKQVVKPKKASSKDGRAYQLHELMYVPSSMRWLKPWIKKKAEELGVSRSQLLLDALIAVHRKKDQDLQDMLKKHDDVFGR